MALRALTLIDLLPPSLLGLQSEQPPSLLGPQSEQPLPPQQRQQHLQLFSVRLLFELAGELAPLRGSSGVALAKQRLSALAQVVTHFVVLGVLERDMGCSQDRVDSAERRQRNILDTVH